MQVPPNNGQGRAQFVCRIAGESGGLFVAGSQMINQVVEVPNEISKLAKKIRFRDALIRAVKLDFGE